MEAETAVRGLDTAPPKVAPERQRLAAGSLGVTGVIFCIVTGAAPIAAMLFNGPLAVLGVGWAAPAAFLVTGIALIIFSVGYVEMAKRASAAGGFYTFVSHGLGRTLGLGAAMSVAFAYLLFACQQNGTTGYWLSTTLNDWTGIDIAGWVITLLAIALTVSLAYFRIRLTAKILGTALVAEVVALLILSFVILFQGGDSGVSLEPLNPAKLFSSDNTAEATFGSLAVGIALFGAYFSWVGFEMGPNYAEESRNPKRIMGPATFGAVVGLTVLYVFCMWMFVTGWGQAGTSHSVALQYGLVDGQSLPHQYGSAWYPLTDRFVGNGMTHVFEALIVTSSIACGLALYNTASRYLFSMGREGILPKFLGRTHPTHKTPWNANLAAGLVMLVYAVLFILSDSSTLAQLTKTSTYGALMGVCALLLVQILCSVAIIRYFMTTARDGFHWWKTLVAPVLGGAAIIFASYSLLKYRADLAGGYPLFVKAIPWVVLASFIIGLGLALYFKSRMPERYEAVGRYVEADVQGELEPVLDTSGKGA